MTARRTRGQGAVGRNQQPRRREALGWRAGWCQPVSRFQRQLASSEHNSTFSFICRHVLMPGQETRSPLAPSRGGGVDRNSCRRGRATQGGSGSFLCASAPHSRLRSSNDGKGAGAAPELPPPPRPALWPPHLPTGPHGLRCGGHSDSRPCCASAWRGPCCHPQPPWITEGTETQRLSQRLRKEIYQRNHSSRVNV